MTSHIEHVLERLNAYLDMTLSREDAALVRRHLAECGSCRAALEKIKHQHDVDPWQAESLWAHQPPIRGQGFFWVFFAALAVAAIALAGAICLLPRAQAEPL